MESSSLALQHPQEERSMPEWSRVQHLRLASLPKGSGLELVLYENVAMGDGRQANNPWLQELPDPITKASGIIM